MKYILIIFILIISFIGFSQKHEFNFNTKLGTSTKNLKPINPVNTTRRDYYSALTNTNDKGIFVNYKYRVFNNLNLFLSTGLEFSQSKYYFKVIENHEDHLANVFINKKRLTLHVLGLSKEFNFYDGNIILDLGVDWIERFYFTTTDNYVNNYTRSEIIPWIDYKYSLTINYKGDYHNTDHVLKSTLHHNAEFHLHVKFKMTDKLFLNFGFNYAKNMAFYYKYRTDFLYYHNGETVPYKFYSDLDIIDVDDRLRHGVKNDFLYFNVGLSYKFDKFNFKKQ